MTKTKKSVGLKLLLCIMFVAYFVAMFAGFGSTTAYAATTPYYLANGTWERINPRDGESGTGRTPIYGLYMYGSSYSGSGTLTNNAYINWDYINFYLDTDSKVENIVWFRIQKEGMSDDYYYGHENGTGGASRHLWGGTLPDGKYDVSIIASYQTTVWLIAKELHEYSFDYSFTVDTTAPTISGASTSTTYTNSEFTVSASDSGSGIKALYYKAPNTSSYLSTSSTSKTISAGSTNGLYSFYAVDNAGNQSSTYYVMYDATAPTGSIKSSSGSVLTTSYTNGAFSYSASDSHSGISYLQYKTPSSSSWTTYTSGTTISTSATNGKYTFRAVDKAGNMSAEQCVYLDTTKPTGTLYGGNNVVNNGGTTSERYVKFVPSDSLSGVKASYVKQPNSTSYVSYTSGSQYADLGTYFFYSVDNANNQSQTYTITLAEAHIHSYSASVISPTCTESGYTLYSCFCGASYTEDEVAPLGHNYTDWTMVNSTSCTSTGTRKSYCTRCNETKIETVSSLGHSYTELISNSGNSCLAAGTTVYKCSRCESTQTITGTALGHNYRTSIKAATCTESGYTIYTCLRCNDSYTDNYVDALGHNYIRALIESTCTESGGTKHTCSRCYDSYMTDVTTPLGHVYIESVIEPTCTEKGFVLHSCARCGNEYKTDEVLPTGHQYSSNVITTASCEGTGERYHSCEWCGDNYTTQIAATGHNYEIVQEDNRNGTIYRVYACSACGNSYTEELGEQYAEVSNYIVYLMDEYKPYMVWVFLATAGVWSIAMGVAMIIAHKNEDKEKAKKMLVNYLVGMVAIFCILVACPFLVRGIAVLVS